MRFGRSAKPANLGKHRRPAGEATGADLEEDHELESYLTALAPASDPEVTDPGRGFGSAKVHQLRLPPGAEERLQWIAERTGVPPQSLIHDWVIDRLSHEASGFAGYHLGNAGADANASGSPNANPAPPVR